MSERLARLDSIVFDLDGTLWDTCASCAIGWNNVARRRGIAFREITADDVRSVTGRPHAACIREIFVGLPEEQLLVLAEETQDVDTRVITDRAGFLFPGVAEGPHPTPPPPPLSLLPNYPPRPHT